MVRDDRIAEEINELWAPVYPYMVDHLLAEVAAAPGNVLDLGPFSGGMAVELLGRLPHLKAIVQDEADGVLHWVMDRAKNRGVAERVQIRRGAFSPLPWPDEAFDLVLVRGAFFFLTPALLAEIGRVLRPCGFGWVGGGYGPRTPAEVIVPIGARSKILNEALGKRWSSVAAAAALVDEAGLAREARVVEEGGLWIEVRPCS